MSVVVLLCCSAQVPQATPSSTAQASELIGALAAKNATLQHYTFIVQARIALLTFPWIRFTLYGHGTYTRGGDFIVHFDNVPWFGRGYDTMPMGALDTANWPSLYTMSVAERGNGVTILSMHDVKKSPLTEARATLDDVQGLKQILWTYNYGGHVKLTVVPAAYEGYYLPSTEEAEIVMPQYRAMAWATFTNYHIETSATPSADAGTTH